MKYFIFTIYLFSIYNCTYGIESEMINKENIVNPFKFDNGSKKLYDWLYVETPNKGNKESCKCKHFEQIDINDLYIDDIKKEINERVKLKEIIVNSFCKESIKSNSFASSLLPIIYRYYSNDNKIDINKIKKDLDKGGLIFAFISENEPCFIKKLFLNSYFLTIPKKNCKIDQFNQMQLPGQYATAGTKLYSSMLSEKYKFMSNFVEEGSQIDCIGIKDPNKFISSEFQRKYILKDNAKAIFYTSPNTECLAYILSPNNLNHPLKKYSLLFPLEHCKNKNCNHTISILRYYKELNLLLFYYSHYKSINGSMDYINERIYFLRYKNS